MRYFLILMFALLAACGHDRDVAVVKSVSTVYVDRPVACPPPAETDKLLAERPAPLRDDPMPPTAVERVAKSSAQLGKYEADGGWGDKVEAALKRCRNQ